MKIQLDSQKIQGRQQLKAKLETNKQLQKRAGARCGISHVSYICCR